MNKHANVLTMLSLMHQKEKIKINELMSVLDISDKQVRRYRDELNQIGIKINSTTGKDGGYTLDKRNENLFDNVYQEELDKLIGLLSHLDLEIVNIYNALLVYFEDNLNEILSLYNMDPNTLYALIMIHVSKKSNKSLRAQLDTGDEVVDMLVNPYLTYKKYDVWYVYCFNDYTNSSIHLEINELKDLKTTDEGYTVPVSQVTTTRNVLSSKVGIYIQTELNVVKIQSNTLQIEDVEHIFECNVEEEENQFMFNSYNLDVTKAKVMSLGDSVVVLEPVMLRQMIKKDIDAMVSIYNTSK